MAIDPLGNRDVSSCLGLALLSLPVAMTLAPGSSRFDALMDQCSEFREVGKVIRLKGWGNQGLDQDDSWAFSVVTYSVGAELEDVTADKALV